MNAITANTAMTTIAPKFAHRPRRWPGASS